MKDDSNKSNRVTETSREQRLTEAEIRDLTRFPSENANPVMRISGDGVIIYANDASESLLHDWNTVESGIVPKEWRKIIKGALKSGKNEESEIILRDRVFSFNITPITDAGYVNIYGRDITKRKKMEAELRESEETWRSLSENAPNFIIIVDRDGVIQFINRTVSGYSMEDTVGKKVYDFMEPEYHDISMETIKQVFKTGEPGVYETKVTVPQVGTYWYETQVGSIKRDGKIVAATLISTDITERKNMEEELENWNWALGERVKELNCLYGISKLIEQPGINFNSILQGTINLIPPAWQHPEVTCARVTVGDDVFTTENFMETEWRLSSDIKVNSEKEGALDVFYMEEMPVFDKELFLKEERNLINAIVERLGRLIERKKMEEETRQYQKRLEALHSHASLLALASTVEEVSNITLDTMTDALGFYLQSFQTVENDTLIIKGTRGGPPWNMPLPVEGKGITAKVAREALSILLNDVRKDPDFIKGSTESLSELAVPVISEGKVVAVLNVESVRLDAFTLRDQQLLELLANHVANALTRIWSQRDLLELRERHSVELVRGIQRVSSMVRHDLRGPLQTIMNANYLLGKDPDSFDEMREIITSSVKHANEIMEDWKNQGIDERLTLSDTDIQALIEEALDISLIPGEVKVSQNVEPRVLHLDRVKTHRALGNLIRNAVEAMPEGGDLVLEGRVDGDDYLLEVKDTGTGISGDGLSKLFTPFYTTKPDGMGLGLAFCKRAVEAYGGSITVESKVGEGTTFTIRLPLNPCVPSARARGYGRKGS